MSKHHLSATTGSMAIRVVEAVADQRGVDPMGLNPPLATVLDPEALDALAAADPECALAMQFTYADCLVTITGTRVDVRPLRERDR